MGSKAKQKEGLHAYSIVQKTTKKKKASLWNGNTKRRTGGGSALTEC